MANRRRKGRRTFGATRQLPSGRWQASYLAPDGKRRSADYTFPEAADANAFLANIEAKMGSGDWRAPEPSRQTFGAYGDRFLAAGVSRLGRPYSPTTAELYEGLWRRWIRPTFGDTALGDLTAEAWRAWHVDQIRKHPKSTQPAKAYSLARAILNQAVADELIRVNPCRVKGAGRESAPERPIVMPDQVAAIAGAMTDRYRAMVFLGSYCSLRFGELAGLRRRRVDLLHRRLILDPEIGNAVGLSGGVVSFRPPKADSARTVAIPAGLIEILEHHLEHFVGADPDALVFTTSAGDPLHRAKFRKPWAAALAGAGIAPIHFHDLRGSGATWAATSGATVKELMARLGHSTQLMAMRYQHATEERDQEIANRLDALMKAAAVVSEPEPKVISIGS